MALDLLTHEIVAKATVMGERRWRLDAAADVVVDADRHRLTEAVMNLVHNAVMHTSTGDTIAVGSSATASEWRIWVRDSGVGLPPTPTSSSPTCVEMSPAPATRGRASAWPSCGSSRSRTGGTCSSTACRDWGRRSRSSSPVLPRAGQAEAADEGADTVPVQDPSGGPA